MLLSHLPSVSLKLPLLVAETSDLGSEDVQVLSHCFEKQCSIERDRVLCKLNYDDESYRSLIDSSDHMIRRISNHYFTEFDAAAADAHVGLNVYGVDPIVLRNTHVSAKLRARRRVKGCRFPVESFPTKTHLCHQDGSLCINLAS